MGLTRPLTAALLVAAAMATAAAQPDLVPQGVPQPEAVAKLWPADPLSAGFSLGNHRAEVGVPEAARSQPAVLVHVVWRRRSQPNATIVVAAKPVAEQYANASVLRNVAVLQSTMHEATIVFEPAGVASVHLYFLPYHFSGGSGGYASRFGAAIPADIQPDPAWLAAHNQTQPAAAGLPWANVSAFTARTKFDSFTPMEQAASPAEMTAHSWLGGEQFALFTEKRTNSIRMNDALPISWLSRTNRTTVTDTVQPREFYAFQVGVYATPGHDVTVESFSVSPSSLAAAINCFNLGGTRFNGTNFTQSMQVNSSRVGALWFGVDTSAATDAAWLNATVHLKVLTAGGSTHVEDVSVSLTIAAGEPIKGKGDFDPWRLSRLRWLDSTEGRDFNVSKGFIPLTVAAAGESAAAGEFTVELLERSITVNRSTGLPSSILVKEKEILAAPMEFQATDHTGQDVPCAAKNGAEPTHLGDGAISWTSECELGTLLLTVRVTASYEGYLDVVATVSNGGSSAVSLQDLRLVVALPKETATFMMGLGAVSGYRPPEITWPWSALGSISDYQNESVKKWGPMNPGDAVSQAWLGCVDRGLRIALKGPDPSWESPEDYPKGATALGMTDWSNCLPAQGAEPVNRTFCKGVVSVSEFMEGAAGAGAGAGAGARAGGETVVRFSASLGPLTLAPAEKKELPFDLLVTPLKPFNLSQHFRTRYWHFGGEFPPPDSGLSTEQAVQQMVELNITWVVIHQGSNLNPYINYPLRSDLMGDPSLQTFVDACHAKGIFVKLYFTTRELSNRCTEIFALKSLPHHEVLYGVDGTSGQEGGGSETGGGGAWLQEHLGGDYKVAWSTVGHPWLSGIKGVHADEAVADDGASRWDNFYVEANRFLLESPGTDGVYLDAVAFDRTTMERIRKNMERTKDNVRVDIHRSGGWFCHGPGYGTPALRYMQHFAWADSLWFGEGFDYWGQSPEWWLLETSGLPFGLTGDMIREGTVGPDGGCTADGCVPTRGKGCPDPNRWLGMVFGMGTRLAWGGLGANMTAVLASPEVQEVVPVWRFWGEWGIADAQMVGWWDEAVLVTTSDPAVKATVYLKEDKSMLIALGNFGSNMTRVTLTFQDGKPKKLSARAIEAYQPARAFGAGEAVPVQAKGGWLLEVVV